jgi:hypothetical protein
MKIETRAMDAAMLKYLRMTHHSFDPIGSAKSTNGVSPHSKMGAYFDYTPIVKKGADANF